MTPQAALQRGLGELALALPPGAPEKLIAYLELLAKWNRTYNLTAIRDPLQAVSLHLLDSLAVLPELPDRAGALADVGSGGGLPGIPLAIAEPARRVTLNDVSEKKGAFLRQAVIELELGNAEVVCERVEAWATPRRFELVISRALSDLAELAALAGRLVAPGGLLAAMKGVYPYEELAQLPAGYRLKQAIALHVPGVRGARHLVLLERA